MYLADLQVHLPVTNQYKHLGGLLDSKTTMAAEARRRLAMATQAFDNGKKLLTSTTTSRLRCALACCRLR